MSISHKLAVIQRTPISLPVELNCLVCPLSKLLIITKGKLKNNVKVENRQKRYAHLLWEFWKKDHELFPKEIMNKKAKAESSPHALIFVFDGSTEDVPNSEEEIKFFRQIIQIAKKKSKF